MAKPVQSPPASAPTPILKRTFTLSRPIFDEKGTTWTELTLVEPELQHQVKAQRGKTSTHTEQVAGFFAALSGVPEAAIRKLKTRDAHRMKAWVDTLSADGPEDAEPSLHESERRFELVCPIITDNMPLTALTVREPDLECAIAVERMATQAERTAALIASLSGVTIPIIMRMKMRDVVRIESWLGFFLPDGEASMGEAPPASGQESIAGAP